jgi:hypothetical protein
MTSTSQYICYLTTQKSNMQYNNNNNGSSYIAHFTMSQCAFRAAYYGATGSQAAYNHDRYERN